LSNLLKPDGFLQVGFLNLSSPFIIPSMKPSKGQQTTPQKKNFDMMNDTSENISNSPETDLDWENRRLCSDDSCIGVIGADGRCGVCGLLNPDAPGGPDLSTSRNADKDEPHEPHSEDQVPEPQDPGWEDRKLCSDESCIGTIGTDGRCRVCGLTG
jgi:hypothetical protein